uniref:Metalloendopeptidase n=1 Tax=Pygocentrus nattereri TaxID=42514 RepID=A0A3B4CC29_PYGNA
SFIVLKSHVLSSLLCCSTVLPSVETDLTIILIANLPDKTGKKCFWKKSSNGLLLVPFTVSNDFCLSLPATFHSKTCIRFVSRTLEADYLSIQSRAFRSALLLQGGVQVVSLSRNGCVYHGIAQHELNHALGFYQEHTRSDRDYYVRINWANISPTLQYNFNKENTNNLNTPYDYSSVMHYGKTAFSMNGQDTITPIPDPSVPIGQRVDLSAIDIKRINILYNC